MILFYFILFYFIFKLYITLSNKMESQEPDWLTCQKQPKKKKKPKIKNSNFYILVIRQQLTVSDAWEGKIWRSPIITPAYCLEKVFKVLLSKDL